MLNLRNVLVATDRGPLAERVYSHALALADRFECRIHLLHVVPLSGRTSRKSGHGIPGSLSTSNLERLRAIPGGRLIEAEESAPSVPRAIIAYAEEHDIDLILMGGRSSSGLAASRLGGVPGPVIRYAPCSVMTVRDAFPQHGLRRILVPVDLSEASRAQLAIAREFAAFHGAPIDLLTVLESKMYPASFAIAPMIGLEPEMRRRWEERLADFWDDTDGPEVPYRPHLRTGAPGAEIINFTLQQASDMIVIGTHGKTGLRRLVLGSVAAQVTQRALCATLTVKTFGRPLVESAAILEMEVHA